MGKILIGIGKIITFLALLSLFIILIYKVYLGFPMIENNVIIYLLIVVGGMLLVIMPEIKKFNFFGFGIERERPTLDIKETETTGAKDIKNNI